MRIHTFTFNPFSENTYVAIFDDGTALIADPGMMGREEQAELADFINQNGLGPRWLVNTHGHIDHILGNRYCADQWQLGLLAHPLDLPTLQSGERVAAMYGLPYDVSPEPAGHLVHGQLLRTAEVEWEIRFAPGHAPGHVVLVCHSARLVLGGDVLFRGSVGRVDLPGGDGATLDGSIRTQLYTLPDDYTVLPGHGEPTTIGWEKENNPYVNTRQKGFFAAD